MPKKNEHCSSCRFWDPRSTEPEAEATDQGDCLRYPPARGSGSAPSRALSRMMWPTTRAEDWCGEYDVRQ